MTTFVPAEFDKVYVLERDTHTIFDDLVGMLASLTAYMYMADTIRTGMPSLQKPQHPFGMNCMTSSDVYDVFPYELTRLLSQAKWPTEFRVYENVVMTRTKRGELTGEDHQRFVRQIIGSSFLRYYESQIDALVDSVGEEPSSWPEPWNFARVLRNAFAHDGIWFSNPAADPVSWRTVTFGPEDNGKHPLFPILGLGDVAALLLELDEAIRADEPSS